MSKNKVITGSVADGSSLSGMYLYGYLLVTSSHGKKRVKLFDVSPYKDTNPIGLGPHSYDLNLNYLLICSISKYSHIWG